MKNYLLIFLLAFVSCKNNNPSGQPGDNKSSQQQETPKNVSGNTSMNQYDTLKNTPKEQVNETIKQPDSLYRLVIFFYSVASGIEFDLMNQYLDSVGMYSQNTGRKIKFEKNAWGREGETDVVMRLTELTPAQQAEFVTMTRRILSKGEHVNIYENYPYKRRGR